MDSPFEIAPTCIAPVGMGLFVKDCKFAKGDVLPFSYPGKRVSLQQFKAANDALFALSERETSKNARILKQQIGRLLVEFDICIVLPPASRGAAGGKHHSKSFGPAGQNIARNIDWIEIYDSFIDYMFEIVEGKIFAYWTAYDYTGKVVPDPRMPQQQSMFGLYMNEPPPYDYFYNTFHPGGREQISHCNVKSDINEDGTDLVFIALRDIRPYDELLFSYGPFYRRINYEINMHGIPHNNLQAATFRGDKLAVEAFEEKRRQFKSHGVLFIAAAIAAAAKK